MDRSSDEKESCEWREAEEVDVYPLLLRERPESSFVHNLIKGSLKWSRACPEMKTTLYLPVERRWQGSVIVNLQGPVNTVAIFSPHCSYNFLLSALLDESIIDWKKGPMLFYGLPHNLLVPFEKSLRSSGVPVLESYHFHMYWLEASEARKQDFSVPEGYRISQLESKHAWTLNSVWPYASKESLKLVSDMIRINPSVGIFAEEKLVSWILQTYYGLGMLHTVEEYRRRGLGELAVKAISKRVGSEGGDVSLLVRENNEPAQSIFKRQGFTNLGLLGVLQVRSES